MEKAKVYFTDFRTVAGGDGLPTKLKKLIRKAGVGQIDMDGKFVAIKMHFGELGNISFLRPNYARAVVDVVREAIESLQRKAAQEAVNILAGNAPFNAVNGCDIAAK